MLEQEVDDAVDERAPPPGTAAGEVLVEHLLELGDGRFDGGLEQRLLGGVVVEHARLGVSGAVGDVLQRGRGEPDGRELLERGLLELFRGADA